MNPRSIERPCGLFSLFLLLCLCMCIRRAFSFVCDPLTVCLLFPFLFLSLSFAGVAFVVIKNVVGMVVILGLFLGAFPLALSTHSLCFGFGFLPLAFYFG